MEHANKYNERTPLSLRHLSLLDFRRSYSCEDIRPYNEVKTTERAAICDKHSAAKSSVVLYRSADDGWH